MTQPAYPKHSTPRLQEALPGIDPVYLMQNENGQSLKKTKEMRNGQINLVLGETIVPLPSLVR